ncbi:hypothetical protein [Hydrogenimonas urashimensis]|uniref:hypothetical protein n=1 Tax=Hydrogenimonas urashimensis TaxID=2740515 RepID=UPI001914F39D|nr:hypothetical protein [Hydrogenimonas urashimensis]
MKKKFLLAGLTLVLTLGGCSAKHGVSELFEPDRIYEKALVYTREDQVVRGLETKAAISATLLNEVFPDKYSYKDGIFFFVGIVTDLDVEEFKKNYHIRLNGMEPLSIQKVESTDDIYRLMPNVNRWGKYFIVKFPSISGTKYTIDFGIYPYGSVQLAFQRPTKRR